VGELSASGEELLCVVTGRGVPHRRQHHRPEGRAPRCLPGLQEWMVPSSPRCIVFYVATVLYWCCNNTFGMLQLVVFMM
jgi:hypothetical protein